MKKRHIAACLAVLTSLALIPGCSSGRETKDSEVTEKQEMSDTTEPDETPADEDGVQDNVPDDPQNGDASETETEEQDDGQNTETDRRSVTVYSVDDLSGVVVGKAAEIRDEFDIWNALKDSGILTEECELLSIKLNDDQTMDLDFNRATAERINSMGTTGETEIIGCIVNTYLEAYDCTGIRLLEDGEDFVSSHGAVFDQYPGRIEFK